MKSRETTSDAGSAKQPVQADLPSWQFRIFYDADCPLCDREIALIRRLDRGRGQVDFVDLSAQDFDASAYGLKQADIEARIHGMFPDGRVIEGVDVFVALYGAVGWGWITAPAGWPGIRTLLDMAYVWFARNRLRLTGRAPKLCDSECDIEAHPLGTPPKKQASIRP